MFASSLPFIQKFENIHDTAAARSQWDDVIKVMFACFAELPLERPYFNKLHADFLEQFNRSKDAQPLRDIGQLAKA